MSGRNIVTHSEGKRKWRDKQTPKAVLYKWESIQVFDIGSESLIFRVLHIIGQHYFVRNSEVKESKVSLINEARRG